MLECFTRYLEHHGKRVGRTELEMNLNEKQSEETLLSDVAPLVVPDVIWRIEEAALYVPREIVPLLPGEAWQGAMEGEQT